MRISYYLMLVLTSLYLCALNFIFFKYIYAGVVTTQNPIFLGILLSVLVFLIFLAVLFLLAPPRIFKLSSSILIALSSISAYFMHKYGVILDIDMLLNLFETDTKEALSYINFGLILWLVLSIVLPICLLYFVKISYKNGTKRAFIRAFGGFFAIFFIIAGTLYLNSQSIIPFFRDNNLARKLHVPFYPLYSMVKAIYSLFDKPKEFEMIASDATKKADENPKILVFVLGETARSKNFQALGYTKNNTNEFTKKFVDSKNALYFNIKACGTATITSIPCMFAHVPKSEYNSKIFAQNAVDFLDVVGVKTLWLGNNTGGCKGVCDRVLNSYLKADFDTSLLEKAKEFIKNANTDSILFLHLQGSHGPTYYKRYPKEFEKFLPTCNTSELAKCSEDEIQNTYDNTILFTDYFISELIKELQLNNKVEGSLIYVSDHGESLGENGIYLHGLPYNLAPDVQKQVPMFFYSNNKDKVDSIKQNENFSHDNIFHTLLGFFGVQSKYYDKKLDIFN